MHRQTHVMQVKVEAGQEILLTHELDRWLRRKKIVDWRPGDILTIRSVDSRKKLTPILVVKDGEQGVYIQMRHAQDGRVRWQMLQLTKLADLFFQRLTGMAGGRFIEMQRVPQQGWKGKIVMTEYPEEPKKLQWPVIAGPEGFPATAYARKYVLLVRDDELLSPQRADETTGRMLVSLKQRYAQDKWRP
ncbi:hypothetical protein Rctr85_058 [Virus Rctr85]|nr:hypothetical protein Rctr85_058 [Virus Rctr85]